MLIAFFLLLHACTLLPGTSHTENDPVLGERIDGPANLRDTVNGKKLFTLNDHVLVETSQTIGKWLVAGLFVKLSERELQDLQILPGTDLAGTDGEIVGRTIDTVHVWLGSEEDKTGLIGAYTHVDNIKPYTFPEKALETELRKGQPTLESLEHFRRNFNFSAPEDDKRSGMKESYIYESTIEDLSPRDRITLLFDEAGKLAGFIHSRPVKVPKGKTFRLVRGHSLTVLSDLPRNQINELIENNIRFYNSID